MKFKKTSQNFMKREKPSTIFVFVQSIDSNSYYTMSGQLLHNPIQSVEHVSQKENRIPDADEDYREYNTKQKRTCSFDQLLRNQQISSNDVNSLASNGIYYEDQWLRCSNCGKKHKVYDNSATTLQCCQDIATYYIKPLTTWPNTSPPEIPPLTPEDGAIEHTTVRSHDSAEHTRDKNTVPEDQPRHSLSQPSQEPPQNLVSSSDQHNEEPPLSIGSNSDQHNEESLQSHISSSDQHNEVPPQSLGSNSDQHNEEPSQSLGSNSDQHNTESPQNHVSNSDQHSGFFSQSAVESVVRPKVYIERESAFENSLQPDDEETLVKLLVSASPVREISATNQAESSGEFLGSETHAMGIPYPFQSQDEEETLVKLPVVSADQLEHSGYLQDYQNGYVVDPTEEQYSSYIPSGVLVVHEANIHTVGGLAAEGLYSQNVPPVVTYASWDDDYVNLSAVIDNGRRTFLAELHAASAEAQRSRRRIDRVSHETYFAPSQVYNSLEIENVHLIPPMNGYNPEIEAVNHNEDFEIPIDPQIDDDIDNSDLNFDNVHMREASE